MDEYRDNGVDVKVYSLPPVAGETEELRMEAYDIAQHAFWNSLQPQFNPFIADLGIESVYADGRSGGWAVPSPALEPDSHDFLTFKGEVEYCLDDAKALYVSELELLIENAKREEQEAQDEAIRLSLIGVEERTFAVEAVDHALSLAVATAHQFGVDLDERLTLVKQDFYDERNA